MSLNSCSSLILDNGGMFMTKGSAIIKSYFTHTFILHHNMFYKEIAQDYFKIAYRIFHGRKYSVHWQVSTKTDNALEVGNP
jgi:hypothetical protein